MERLVGGAEVEGYGKDSIELPQLKTFYKPTNTLFQSGYGTTLNPYGRLPRTAAGALLRGHLRGGPDQGRCSRSDWPAPRLPLVPDAGGRDRRTGLRRRRGSPGPAGPGRRCGTSCRTPQEPLVVNATIGAGGALLAFAGHVLPNPGVQPPAYDWANTCTTLPPKVKAMDWPMPKLELVAPCMLMVCTMMMVSRPQAWDAGAPRCPSSR